MAIDMIESNELSALAPSRLGLKQFADEGFKNYTGSEDFFNLFGSRRRKKSAIRDAVVAKYKDLPTDCDNIDSSIAFLTKEVSDLQKQKRSLQQREALDEATIILNQFKALKTENRCAEIKAAREKEAERIAAEAPPTSAVQPATTGVIPTGGAAPVQQVGLQPISEELAQESVGGIDNRNLLIYGGIGLAVLVGIALILRK